LDATASETVDYFLLDLTGFANNIRLAAMGKEDPGFQY
jgi:hypothetical protein